MTKHSRLNNKENRLNYAFSKEYSQKVYRFAR